MRKDRQYRAWKAQQSNRKRRAAKPGDLPAIAIDDESRNLLILPDGSALAFNNLHALLTVPIPTPDS